MRAWWLVVLLVPVAAALPAPDEAPDRFRTPCLDDHGRRFAYDFADALDRRDGDTVEVRY